ncbi:MAG: MarR family transcriptional regulator [Proteobacteria bacterium]|nr:MarR family transcriptional regulator [Pseudomonadota bacterium]
MQRRSVPSLQSHLGYWLRLVSNRVSRAFADKVALHDVSVAEWVVLREIFDARQMSPSLLAERIGMTRGAVTKIADKLVAKGLAARTTGIEDRRTQTLALTASGRRLVPTLAALADRNDADVFGDMPAQDRRALERMLREIAERRGFTEIPID